MEQGQKKKIAILTNIIPTYRQGFYDRILKYEDYDIMIYSQARGVRKNIKVINDRYRENVVEVDFYSIKGETVVWHKLPWWELLTKYEVLIVDGNPRHVSQAMLSTVARLIGRKVVVWSTYTSRRNATFDSKLRQTWWRVFKYFLAYTERDARQLVEAGWNSKYVVPVNNGIDQDLIEEQKKKWNAETLASWKAEQGLTDRQLLLSSGRVLAGRFDLLLDALVEVVNVHPKAMWVLIGDGDGLEKLKDKAKDLQLEDHVLFLGSVYEEAQLAPWFMTAKLFLYTEAIGLSLMHAFGYELPAIIHNEIKTHGPEASIFDDGNTGLLYDKESPMDFASKVNQLLTDRVSLQRMKKNVLKKVTSSYNTRVMAERFDELISRIT